MAAQQDPAPPSSKVLYQRTGAETTITGTVTFQGEAPAPRQIDPLTISNGDPTQHNTHPMSKVNEEWNVSQAQDSTAIVRTFKWSEVFIPFKDNQHPWEKAYVGVFSHPFFAVSDSGGRYKIEGLTPGNYTLAVWHERFGEKTVELTVGANEVKTVNFTFKAGAERLKN